MTDKLARWDCYAARLLDISQRRIFNTDFIAFQAFSDVFPHLVTAADVPKLTKIDDVDFTGVDAVFCCLPHATTQNIIKALPEHLKIVDLSADFRLANVQTYAEW